MPHFQKETKTASKSKKKKNAPVEEGTGPAKLTLTIDDIKVGDVLECVQTPNPGDLPVRFSATVKHVMLKKRKPFVLTCSDGQVRYTAFGADMEWKLQTDDVREEQEEVEALRWVGERSPLAISQAKVQAYTVRQPTPVESDVVLH